MARDKSGSFLERNGGYAASLAVHAMILFMLMAQRVETKARDPQPMDVLLQLLPEPTPSPTPLPEDIQPVLPEDNRATEGTESPTDTPVSADQPTMAPTPEAAPQPQDEEKQREQAVLAELARQKKALEVKRLELAQTRKEFRDQLQTEWSQPERSPGPKTEGSLRGAVRSLELSNQPEEVVNKVLQRYKMKILWGYIDGPGGYNFLNSASTGDGTYLRRSGTGWGQVFQLSTEAVAKMASLETEEIRRRGLDPLKTRVVETVFGIVKAGADYDLGVVKMEVEPLP